MNNEQDHRLDHLVQITAGLLASGHYTRLEQELACVLVDPLDYCRFAVVNDAIDVLSKITEERSKEKLVEKEQKRAKGF